MYAENVIQFLMDSLNISQARLSKIVGITERTLINWKSLSDEVVVKRKGFSKLIILAKSVLYFIKKGFDSNTILDLLLNPFYELSTGQLVSIVNCIKDLDRSEDFVNLLTARKYEDFITEQEARAIKFQEDLELVV